MKIIKFLVLTSLVVPVLLQDEPLMTPGTPVTQMGPPGMEDRMKMFSSTPKSKVHRRTTPPRVSFPENCDYLAFYCLKAFITGKVCARSAHFTYYTFKNYCMLDYVNCMERYDLWQPVYMGECIEIKPLDEYGHYPYDDDLFLDQYYIIEDV
ncbi:uncharacterized protein LOC121737744 [Aricia agestis]|uniref:uncharacterized protein LOC121737744 n=1 Tax=Aricia agestis TaxID=91739 RepID=UPI001C209E24|nr:uncharacterized protein LOC121737744 [Aricia agestis]